MAKHRKNNPSDEASALTATKPRIAQAPCEVYLVSETHWDRAWYLPFEAFRRRLVTLLDRVSDVLERDPDFTCFVADGQTAVIEDYLQIRPGARERLAALVAAGRLKIGPWYVLPDEFIVGGESLVRNLETGLASAAALGGSMKVGYVPDPFGHVAQLPQILRGFGIGSFLFSRGLIPETTGLPVEFAWQAPDGSEVLAVNQRFFYLNAMNLGYEGELWYGRTPEFSIESALNKIEAAVEALAPHSQAPHYLLNNGADHLMAQAELPQIVEAARRRWPAARIRIAGFDDYLAAVARALAGRKLPAWRGELTYPYGDLLKGVYSARAYLKQANAHCEALLTMLAEPLEAAAALARPWRTDERDLLGYAWRELMKNHPHDDICGCSVDSVHHDMMNRFARVEQLAEATAAEAMSDVAGAMTLPALEAGGAAFALFNPGGRARSGAQRLVLQIPLDDAAGAPAPGRMRLADAEGREIPYEVVGTERAVWLEAGRQMAHQAVEIVADAGPLPPCGFAMVTLAPRARGERAPKTPPRVKTGARSLENEFLKLRVASDGSWDLADKRTGAAFKGLGVFEDTEDAGDEYNWSDVAESETLTTAQSTRGTSSLPEIEIVAARRLEGTLRVTQRLAVPAALSADRQRRAPGRVELTIVSELTLRAGAGRVEVRTRVENRARDHRLRVLFPTGIDAETIQAGGHFDTIERATDPARRPQAGPAAKFPICPTEHFAGFVRAGDERAGLAVLARGLCEYESIAPTGGRAGGRGVTLALTLLRCVDMVSRGDLRRRPGDVGPSLAAPEAQMQGSWTFDYAVCPHGADWAAANLAAEAAEFAAPLRAWRARWCDRRAEGLPIRVQENPPRDTLPARFSLVDLGAPELVLSSLRRSPTAAPGAREWLVRFYNPTPRRVRARIACGLGAASAWRVSLGGRRLGAVAPGRDGRLAVTAEPHEIVTLALRIPAPEKPKGKGKRRVD